MVVGSFTVSGANSANPSACGMEKLLERLCLGVSSEWSGGQLSPRPSRLSPPVSVENADIPLGGSSSGGIESVRGCLLILFRLAPASEPLPSEKLQPFTASTLLIAGRLPLYATTPRRVPRRSKCSATLRISSSILSMKAVRCFESTGVGVRCCTAAISVISINGMQWQINTLCKCRFSFVFFPSKILLRSSSSIAFRVECSILAKYTITYD